MTDKWQEGYREGYSRGHSDGYEKALRDKNSQPFKISDPGATTQDGLSYEEIYGSVVYQQNKKKEN